MEKGERQIWLMTNGSSWRETHLLKTAHDEREFLVLLLLLSSQLRLSLLLSQALSSLRFKDSVCVETSSLERAEWSREDGVK